MEERQVERGILVDHHLSLFVDRKGLPPRLVFDRVGPAVIPPFPPPFHPFDLVHQALRGGIVLRHRLMIGIVKIAVAGTAVLFEGEIVDLPERVLLVDGAEQIIDLPVGVHPVLLARAAGQRRRADHQNQAD